ncbi:MAG: branched-chain amino acid aminotransferase [archaeon GW2011_AR3]|nr:MAG: branched-chain amino acid aminotransferase [archaeon GW2011_AR3]MBS3108991.1 aminotransferase class IV [Candidatus Woesearchaeota archaeon]
MEPEFRLDVDKPYVIYRHDTRGNTGFYSIVDYLKLFPGSPVRQDRDYGKAGFEGALAVPSSSDPEIVNFLTLDENVNRLMRTAKVKLISERGNENEYERPGARFRRLNPGIEMAADRPQIYLVLDFNVLRDAHIGAIIRNIESGALHLKQQIYLRPGVGRDDKFVEGPKGERVMTIAPGVEGLGAEGYVTIATQNVDSYLAGKVPPRVLVWEPEIMGPGFETKTRGVRSPMRNFKTAGNYDLPGTGKDDASRENFHEILITDNEGNVLEGGGENVFMVKNGVLYTPPLSMDILPGTKRKKVLEIADALGIPVKQEPFHLRELFEGDAMAFSGTWMGFGPVEYLFQYTIGKTRQFPLDNEYIEGISNAYQDIINDRELSDPKLKDIQHRMLTRIQVPKQKK